MTAVYEVEFEHPTPGIRFLRHVRADSEDAAVALAVQRQASTMPVVAVRLVRECLPGELDRPLRGSSTIPTIIV